MIYSDYEILLSKLMLEYEKETPPNTYLFSIYLDTGDQNRSDIETLVKSWLNKGFENKAEFKNTKQLKEDIRNEVVSELKGLEFFDKGLAIFFNVDLDKRTQEREIHVIKLAQTPKNEVTISKIYDLDQLVWIDHLTKPSLVINIQPQQCDVFMFENEKLKDVDEFESSIIDTEPSRYVETFSPQPSRGQSKQFHGTGTKENQKQEKQAKKKFFKKVIESIEDIQKKHGPFRYIMVYHSPSFRDIKKHLESTTRDEFKITPILEEVSIETEHKLEKKTQELINNLHKSQKYDILDEAKSNQRLYAEGWKEVSEASRKGEIEILFIKPDTKKRGYILNQNLIYIDETPESNEIENIGPWLVRHTLDHGGRVYVFENDKKLEHDVAAKLRFKS